MTATTTAPGYRLLLDDPSEVPVTLVRSPQHSVVAMLTQSIVGHSGPAPAELVGTGVTQARELALIGRSLGATTARTCAIPDCATPIPPVRDVTVAEQAAALRELDPDRLRREVIDCFGPDAVVDPAWQASLQDPSEWYSAMADLSQQTWSRIRRRWRRCEPLLTREAERVGSAVVRGQLDVLLNSLHPRLSYRDGELLFSHRFSPEPERLGDRRLVLVPLLAGPEGLLVSLDQPDIVYLGYPLPGASGSAARRHRGDDEDMLGTVMGPLRAAALRALGRPLNAGELAAEIGCAPNTVTYHCDQLEAAGLVQRRRVRQSVEITRTLRGDQLVDVLS